MAATSTTDVQYLSKVLYPKGYKDKDLYRNKPLLESMTKNTKFTSKRGVEVPVDYSLTNGIGGTMAGAIANATATKGATFTVPQVNLYGYAFMDGNVWRNAEAGGDDAMFIDYARKQFADGIERLMQDVERQGFASKSGAIAQTSSSTAPSGSTITLQNASDCVFFSVGMTIVASSADGGALAAGTPGFAVITAVDPAVPSITVDGTATTLITGLSTSWYLYRYTIADNNGTANGGFAGLGNWNPITPSSSFYGVNQTLDPTSLAGTRTTDTSNMETVFIRARAMAMALAGTTFETGDVFLHPYQFAALVSSKESAKWIDDAGTYEMGISKMRLGNLTFVEASFCPLLYAHIVPRGGLELHTCGSQPTIGKSFDDPDTDQLKVKLNIDGNILTHAPRNLVRVKLAPTSIS